MTLHHQAVLLGKLGRAGEARSLAAKAVEIMAVRRKAMGLE